MPPRRYGQHFLNDPSIASRIIEASGVGPEDAVLEVGPGRGILTRELAARAKKILAVEIDRRLFDEIERAGLSSNVALRLGDALDLDAAVLAKELGPEYRIVANLPYEITSKFLQKFLPMRACTGTGPVSLTLMLQREVGERLVAKTGEMNRLALFCGYYSEPELLFSVPPGAFLPPPKVRSRVIRLVIRPKPLLEPAAERHFFRLIEAAFAQKRKNLKNSLRTLGVPDLEARLKAAGISPEARPEEISFDRWITLALKM